MQKLNIVFKHNNNPITEPLCAAFTKLGYDTVLWWQDNKPTFDMLHERKPDILICDGADLNQSILNGLKKFSDTKLVVINPRPADKLLNLVNKSLFCYTKTPKTPSLNLDIIEPSANIAQITNGVYDENLSSDILIYTNDDSIIDYKIIGLLTQNSSKYKIKVFGHNRMNIPFYLGSLSLKEASNAIASTKLAIDFGDNYVTYAANQVCTITHFDNKYWPTVTYDNYIDTIDKLLHEDKLRKKMIKQAYKVSSGNSIIDRANYILEKLGYTE